MTCIVAVEFDGGACIGADSWIGNDESQSVLAEPGKIQEFGACIIGACGSTRVFDNLADMSEVPKKRARETRERYARRIALQVQGVAKELTGSNSTTMDSAAIILIGGMVFVLQEDFTIYRSAFGYAAIGAGEAYAHGSLASTESVVDPSERARIALTSAAKHSPKVCEPFHFRRQGARW